MYKTVVVDDQVLVRSGICALLNKYDGVELVGEVDSGEHALQLLRTCAADLVVMEWKLPGAGGLETTARLLKHDPKLKIVIVSAYSNDPFPVRLMEAGAAGFLSKSSSPSELYRGLDAVLAGEGYVSKDVAQRMASTLFTRAKKSPFDELSNRELQVMLMAIEGLKVQDISNKLCLSPKTVSTYRYRMFEKLGVKGEVELTHLALRYGVAEKSMFSQTSRFFSASFDVTSH